MNNSNKTLLQILVEELPKYGGWPNNATHCVCMNGKSFGCVSFTKNGAPVFSNASNEWTVLTDHNSTWHPFDFNSEMPIDRQSAIITSDQYEAALAASDGWIQWAGGECPVDSDAIVEVRYRTPNTCQYNNDRAGDFAWAHDGIDGDIIAYRLVNKHELETACIDVKRDAVKPSDAQLEADLNDCIGQPQVDIKTIRAEMLAVLNDTRLTMNLRAAMKLVDAFIDAGYRKQ